jgi:serine/threonine-protein kinase
LNSVIDHLKAALVDRYAIAQEVGVGGMATVYVAEDLKHHRKVALKVLRPELAAVLGAERFLKEIEVTANLQHPNILPLYDSGDADSFLYYVMPYVDGESLRDKLNREKQLGVEETVKIATAVAAALEYAHRRGVIHRDIKPENILLHGGQPVVADFGIALAVSAAGGTRLTETGLSLGTPHYMSPEQATADRELDARSDVYSLGCVTYEMLVGEPPFTAPTAQAVVAKILTGRPERVMTQRRTVPPHVDAAVHTALQLLAADRFPNAAQYAAALMNPSYVAPSATATGTYRRHGTGRLFRLVWPTVAASLLVVALFGWLRPTSEPTHGMRFGLWLPSDRPLAFQEHNVFGPGNVLAISPDGTRILYVGSDSATTQLYSRSVDELEPEAISGTQRAHSAFFSPDGEWIGFFTPGTPVRLMKVPADGGPAITLVDSLNSLSFSVAGTWGTDNRITYTNREGGLSSVGSDGGAQQVLTTLGPADRTFHFYPTSLPSSKGVLFVRYQGGVTESTIDSQIAVLDLRTGDVRILVEGTYALYVPTGHIVFGRPDGSVWAVAFDEDRLELLGSPVPVLDQVAAGRRGNPQLAIAETGNLVYVATRAARQRRLVLVDRNGTRRPIMEELREFDLPRFSPDGNRIAVAIRDEFGVDNVWSYDVESATLNRVTSQGNNERATWSPDGSRVTFQSTRTGRQEIFWKPVTSSAPAEPLVSGDYQARTAEWSPDGRWLLFRGFNRETGRDIFRVAMEGDRTPQPIAQTPFQETSPAVSPDGRWLAYVTDQSGRPEVVIQTFPVPGPAVQVSVDGGTSPVWSPSGRSLFYRSDKLDGMRSVNLAFDPTPRVVGREVLFDDSPYFWVPYDASFDVDPQSGQFLMVEGSGVAEVELVVVLNWLGELRQRMSND